MVRVLIVYDSRTGNTEKLAKAVANGAHKVSGVEVVLKRAREVTPEDIASADAYAFGSPSHFSIMSGEILTMFTNIYPTGIHWQESLRAYLPLVLEARLQPLKI